MRHIGIACGIALLAAAGCGRTTPSEDAATTSVPAVEAVQARSGTLPLVERLSGIARAADQVELRPEIAGIVEQVLVRSGDAVRRGQPLVRLRSEIPREQLAQAEASLRLAQASANEAEARRSELESQVVRTRALAEAGLVSALEIETREAQLVAGQAAVAQERARVEQARATLAEMRATLERTEVRAPIEGRVGRRMVEPGARVDTDTLMFVLGNVDRLIVDVPLTEAMLARLREGDRVRIAPRGADAEVLEARLTRVPPFLAAGSFSTIGEIDVPHAGDALRPGMFAEVEVLYGESRSATLVPAGALWQDPRTGEPTVWVVRPAPGGAAALESATELSERPLPVERRAVEVVAEGRDAVGLEGIHAGEWVVTVGQHLLADADSRAARVRPVAWERVVALQSLQREHLLERFLEKQQRHAREHGAAPAPSSEYVGADAGATRPAP